jgi:hypothetical protein
MLEAEEEEEKAAAAAAEVGGGDDRWRTFDTPINGGGGDVAKEE